MGVGGAVEGVGVFEAEFEGAGGDGVEDVGGAGEEVGAGGDVVLEGGSGDEEGAELREADEVEGRDGAGGTTEEGEKSAGLETEEGLVEGGLADGVVDDGEAFAGGEVFDLVGEVGPGVENGVVGAGFAGELGLGFGRDGGEDAGSERFGDLGKEEAGAAGSGVDEDGVAGLDGIGGVGEVVGGHALEEGGGGLLEGHGVGDGDEAIDRGGGEFGVGAGDAPPADTGAGFEAEVGGAVDGGAEGDDRAGGFLAEGVGEGRGVAAFAEVGVDEINAGGVDAEESFAGAGDGVGKVLEGKLFGAAGFEDLDRAHVGVGCE